MRTPSAVFYGHIADRGNHGYVEREAWQQQRQQQHCGRCSLGVHSATRGPVDTALSECFDVLMVTVVIV